jgi:type VI secretion system protein ImpG
LREYFLLPDKFCFFELSGLAAALHGSATRHATVTLHFSEALPASVAIEPTAIRAHCVPATNLFRTSAEPWIFEPGRPSAPVRVAGLPSELGGVYAVLGASAMPRPADNAGPIPLQPLRRFAAAATDAEFPYALSTRLEPELVACLTSPRGRPPNLTPHVVSMDLLATNRAHAGAIRPGELTHPGLGMPAGVTARNIRPCSPYVPAPTREELALQVAVRAAVPDGDPLFSLQSRLLALVPRHGVPAAAARANAARVMALQSVRLAAAVDRQAARRGYEAHFTIDEAPFQGLGDVALFLRLLHAALEAQASVGRFYRCSATCAKSGTRLVWPPEAS